MQLPLLLRKITFQSICPSNTEILNILSPGTVEHHIKAVQGFDIRNQLYPFFAGNIFLPEC